ncbi:MAG TPA: hypothetical protein VGF06_01185 [Terriglobales bacterium]
MKTSLAFLLCMGLLALAPAWAAPAADNMVVPAGTQLNIRTNEKIDSNTAQVGQTFSAVVDQDVAGPNGEVLVPKGSDATLILRSASSGGTTGSSGLVLDLNSLTIQGRHYSVSTANLEQSNNQGIGKNKRTGEMVGGGAALGTLLGAIAGGGKGALIGAVAGAAAGGTTQVLTRGKKVEVPPETVLQFKLDQPLELHATS